MKPNWLSPTTIITRPILLSTLLYLCSVCIADINQDKAKCANQLVGLAGCLRYVSGDPSAKAPTADCCSGLKLVVQKSKECLCLLVKDSNDPSLGFKINATLALGLPDKCQTPTNISECPALLHLPPNSPDAKVFDEFGKSGGQGNGTSAAPVASSTGQGSTATVKSDGGKMIKRWLRIEMIMGFSIMVVLRILPNS